MQINANHKFLLLLMAEILHQLIGSFSHYLQGFYIPGGAGFQPSTVVQVQVNNLGTQYLNSLTVSAFKNELHWKGPQNNDWMLTYCTNNFGGCLLSGCKHRPRHVSKCWHLELEHLHFLKFNTEWSIFWWIIKIPVRSWPEVSVGVYA